MYRDLLSQNGAPEIESFRPEVELEAGVSYEMTCKASEPIRWLNKRTDLEVGNSSLCRLLVGI